MYEFPKYAGHDRYPDEVIYAVRCDHDGSDESIHLRGHAPVGWPSEANPLRDGEVVPAGYTRMTGAELNALRDSLVHHWPEAEAKRADYELRRHKWHTLEAAADEQRRLRAILDGTFANAIATAKSHEELHQLRTTLPEHKK
jgi:hypothetical protein